MAEEDKALPQPLFCRDLTWDPFRRWPQWSRIFDQDFGTPPFPMPCDLSWAESAGRQLGTSSWMGYRRAPLFSSSAQTPLHPCPKLPGGVSEILTGQDRWQVNLDVNHFSPEEISIKTKEGYLEITGKHEEREDEHGFVSRYFTRKYKLPAAIDLHHVSSSLSGDGVLSVEGPLPASSHPAEIIIPIQVEEKLQSSECNVKDDPAAVGAKTQETAGGEESGETQAADTEELQTPPTQGPSDEPQGGDEPQQAPAVQSESSVEQWEELQADDSEVLVEERAAVSGGKEAPTQPEGGAAEEQVDPKPAQEEGDVGQEPQEASGNQEDQPAPDGGAEGQGEPGDPSTETGPQQDAAGEPVQEAPESTSADPSQEAPRPEQDVPEQQEIEQVELTKGAPES
ncbi:heat shock protein 67B1 [Anguilla anguilla]|uniref:heat shock protein 67B1 n=1 Tax=Anguilla anguilla TaxID=7936 RepID=UPI0015AD58DB|nr:heat shock protein 67B1 [Anguilla anguilla]